MTEVATYNVHYAKTHFSELIARVERGEKIVVARAGKPVVRLEPYTAGPKLKLGFLDIPDIPDSFFFEPLSEEELAEWE